MSCLSTGLCHAIRMGLILELEIAVQLTTKNLWTHGIFAPNAVQWQELYYWELLTSTQNIV